MENLTCNTILSFCICLLNKIVIIVRTAICFLDLQEKNPDKQRRQGRCPLTPEEVGLMLRSLGYGMDIHIYVASGEIYGGEETLRPLKKLFPNLHSKGTIASKEELEPYSAFSSQMAALDFIVCDESDVVVTNNNGNMAKMLAGKRYPDLEISIISTMRMITHIFTLLNFSGSILDINQRYVQILKNYISYFQTGAV